MPPLNNADTEEVQMNDEPMLQDTEAAQEAMEQVNRFSGSTSGSIYSTSETRNYARARRDESRFPTPDPSIVRYEAIVSGGWNPTLQKFDFFAQWYRNTIGREGVDEHQLKALIETYINTEVLREQ